MPGLGDVLLRGILGEQFTNSFGQQFLTTGLIPVEFSVPPVSNSSALVDQIDGGPYGIAPRIPIPLLSVDHDGKLKPASLALSRTLAARRSAEVSGV